jgi:hypothetical protein
VDGGTAKPVELDEVEAAVDLPPVNVEVVVVAGLLIHSVGSPLRFRSPAAAEVAYTCSATAPLHVVVELPLPLPPTRSITTFSRGMMHLGFLSPGLLK